MEAENPHVYWADETGVSNCESVERDFSPKGHPPVLPVETKRQWVNIISAVSSQGKVHFIIYQDTTNQQRLPRFMGRLAHEAEEKVFLILDNLKVHHGRLAAARLEKHKDKIEVFSCCCMHRNTIRKIRSFMRKLQQLPSLASSSCYHPVLSDLYLRK